MIVQRLFAYFVQCDQLWECISPTTRRQQHPICLLFERDAGGEHPPLPAGLDRGKAEFGTNYVYLDSGSKQLPKSVTATHRLPWILQGDGGPGYVKAYPAGLMQHGSSCAVDSWLSQGPCGCVVGML